MQQDVREHQQRAARIETLIQAVATFPDPQARATTEELIQALLDMYGEGLARMLELIAGSESSGYALIETLASDDLLSSLFLLHGIHPIDIETRIMQALDGVRPYLKSHGGNVEFIKVEDDIAYLRLEGSCHGCPSSTITLKLAIEEAINKVAPDLDGLKVEGVVEPPPRPGMPVTFVPPRRRKESARSAEQEDGWRTVPAGLETLPNGVLKVIPVEGEPLLFCQIADTHYAYHNRCSNCGLSLDMGKLEGTTLTCASCGRQYDVLRAGRCLDAPNLFLEPVPLLVEGSKVKVALSALAKDGSETVLSAPAR